MPGLDIDRLAKDELVYELGWRGFGSDTVERMRKTLRGVLRHEKAGGSLTYPEYKVPFDRETEEIQKKITEINKLVSGFSNKVSVSEYKKIETKIAHILGRIDRLSSTEEESSKFRTNCLTTVLSLETDLIEKCKPLIVGLVRTDAVSEHERNLLELSGNFSRLDMNDGDDVLSSTPLQTSRAYTELRPVPVVKWDLRFSGEKKDLSVGAFLERVDELCNARHFSKDWLLDSAIDLFTGKALIWFRAIRNSVNSWSALAQKLREEFQPHDYDFQLWEEIKRRTQGKDESLGYYVAVMENLFRRLNEPVSEATKLAVLLRNLAPFYNERLGLTEVESVEHLLRLGRNLENRKAVIESYQPPRRNRNDLEPDLAYVDSVSCSSVESNIRCWSCHEVGHRAAKCPREKSKKRLKCFKCGKEDFTVRNCPDCTGNEIKRLANAVSSLEKPLRR